MCVCLCITGRVCAFSSNWRFRNALCACIVRTYVHTYVCMYVHYTYYSVCVRMSVRECVCIMCVCAASACVCVCTCIPKHVGIDCLSDSISLSL